jgi:hypothetical protein
MEWNAEQLCGLHARNSPDGRHWQSRLHQLEHLNAKLLLHRHTHPSQRVREVVRVSVPNASSHGNKTGLDFILNCSSAVRLFIPAERETVTTLPTHATASRNRSASPRHDVRQINIVNKAHLPGKCHSFTQLFGTDKHKSSFA